MEKIGGVCQRSLEKSEWVSIATAGPEGPHLAATWGDYIRKLGIGDNVILIPAGYLHKTEANLKQKPRIELLFASRQVQGNYGPGRGCLAVTMQLEKSHRLWIDCFCERQRSISGHTPGSPNGGLKDSIPKRQ